jgi:hypothetical protein
VDYITVQQLFYSSAIRVLRKDSAAFVISFLYRCFRTDEKFIIPFEEIKARLRNDLEDIHSESDSPENTLRGTADYYLNEWVSEGLLAKRLRTQNDIQEIILEPTKELTKVFSWLEDTRSLERGEVVGTESRFFSILAKLKELAEESQEDPEIKIAQLEAKKLEIENRIAEIRETGTVEILPEERMRSQYLYARKEAMELIADFKQVEGNFSEMTRSIHKKYLETSLKGDILQFVLDKDADLMNSEQGKSFHAFWEFLRSDRNQEDLSSVLDRLYELETIRAVDSDSFFRRFRRLLREAGSRVNTVVSEMSEQLKKSVIETTLRENRRSRELITEIKNLALKQNITSAEDFHFLSEIGGVQMQMERPLWKGEVSDNVHTPISDLTEDTPDWDDLVQAFQGLDVTLLEENIESMLRYKPEVSLQEVLSQFPDEVNLESLTAYLWIASQELRHSVSDTEEFKFFIRESAETATSYNIPNTVYRVGN